MLHECNLNCHTMDPSTMDLIGMEDRGKWLPFIFHMEMVEAAKLASDEEDSPTFNCTTIYTKAGEVYIIDTNYREFFDEFKEYHANSPEPDVDGDLTY